LMVTGSRPAALTVTPTAPVPSRRPTIKEETADDQTDAGIAGRNKDECPYPDHRCGKRRAAGAQKIEIPAEKPAAAKAAPADRRQGGYHSAAEACYSNEILQAARSNVRHRFGNRPRSRGKCAVGVRTSLGVSGAYDGHSLGNGAIDYAIHGSLESMGFKNYVSEFPNPEVAPPGAVLVFSGQHESSYRRTGHIGKPAGDWVGHITIKGDSKHGDDWYYTDGRTKDPTISWRSDKHLEPRKQRRRLVAVYLMKECKGACTSRMRNKCGG
jgi:hypothetical protein